MYGATWSFPKYIFKLDAKKLDTYKKRVDNNFSYLIVLWLCKIV